MPAGITEAGVGPVRITVIQIIVRHADQLLQALRREKIQLPVARSHLDGIIVRFNDPDMIARIQLEMAAVRIGLAVDFPGEILRTGPDPGLGILEFREADARPDDAR